MQFNFIAKYYTSLSQSVYGQSLELAKKSLFSAIPPDAKILIIGGGTGVSLEFLLNMRPHVTIDFVDSSSEMIRLAQTNFHNSGVNFYCSPIEEFTGGGYDVIITEYFLDLFSTLEIEDHIRLIKQKLSATGIWIDTDFRIVRKVSSRILMKLMYLFFRIVSGVKVWKLTETLKIAYLNGFLLRKENTFEGGFITSRLFVL